MSNESGELSPLSELKKSRVRFPEPRKVTVYNRSYGLWLKGAVNPQ